MYRIGRWQIAATLMHEMMHLAGVSSSARDEAAAEKAIDAARLYAPFVQWVRPRRVSPGDTVTIGGISFGPSQGAADRVTLGRVDVGRVLSWRWRHACQGQIRFRVPRNVASGALVVENNTVCSNTVPLAVVPAAEETEAARSPAPAEAAPAPEAAD